MTKKILESAVNGAQTGALVGMIGTIVVACLIAKMCVDDTYSRRNQDCFKVLQLFMDQISRSGSLMATTREIMCVAAASGATIGAGVGLMTWTYSFFREQRMPIEQGEVRRLANT